MKETRKITINSIDLDHILDVDTFLENRDIPPSEIFLENLKKEMELHGLEFGRDIDSIEIIR